MDRCKLIGQANNLMYNSKEICFMRDYKDDVLDYKIQKGTLYFYSELFFIWIKDDLNKWSDLELKSLVKRLESGGNHNA